MILAPSLAKMSTLSSRINVPFLYPFPLLGDALGRSEMLQVVGLTSFTRSYIACSCLEMIVLSRARILIS